MVLQFDVAELVDGAHPAEHTPLLMGVGEEGHQVAGQLRAQGEVPAGHGVAAPGGLPQSGGQAHQQGGHDLDA